MGRILSYKHGEGSVKGVDPRLWDIVQNAIAASPYDAEIRSGAEQRKTNATNHNSGWAVDVTLIDPATGEKIPDYQHGPSFAIYEQFAQTARVYQQERYPKLDNVFRWGGYFSRNGNPFGYGAADLMHLDITPGAKGAMALGSWEHGAKKALLDRYPGAVSNGGLGGANGARLVSQYKSALAGSGGLVPPGVLNDEAPTPADRSGLDDLRRRWAAENAPVPMPRPADRMPAPAASWGSGIPPGDGMTPAQVAELYQGIPGIRQAGVPSIPLPLDPRLGIGAGSLPSARPSLPLPADPRLQLPPGALPTARAPVASLDRGMLGSPMAGERMAATPRYWGPTSFGDQGVRIPEIADTTEAEARDYGPSNRMSTGGFGSLLDPRTASFSAALIERLATPEPVVPSDAPLPRSAGPTGRASLPAPKSGMLSDENASTSFAGNFDNRVRSVPGAAPRSPVGAGAPVSLTPFTRPTLRPQQPVGSGQPISLTPFSRPLPSVPKTQFGGEGMPSSDAGGGRPVNIDPELLRRLDTLPNAWTGLPWAGSATGVPAPPPLPRPRPTVPAVPSVPSVPQWITTTKMVPNPAYKSIVPPMPLNQLVRLDSMGIPTGQVGFPPTPAPARPAVPKMIPQTIRVLNPAYVPPIPATMSGGRIPGLVQRLEQSIIPPIPAVQSAALLAQRRATPATRRDMTGSLTTRPMTSFERSTYNNAQQEAFARSMQSTIG
jgi:hypothetical protein